MPLGDVQRRFLRFTAFSALVLISIKVNFREGGQCCKKYSAPALFSLLAWMDIVAGADLPELSRRAWGRADLSK
jgi:hypothetical protein